MAIDTRTFHRAIEQDGVTNEKQYRDQKDYNTAYWQKRPEWIEALDLKEPLRGTLRKFLNKYAKEDIGEYDERVKRLAQVNFVDLVIEAYNSMIFSTNVRITSELNQDEVQSFVGSCNQQGENLIDYFREMISPSAFLYGVTDVFVDLPRVGGEILTALQQEQAGLNKPYCYIVPPLNRVAWELDDAGNYTLFQASDVINTQIQAQYNVRDKSQYLVWTPDTVSTYNSKGEAMEDRPNPFHFIPAVTVLPRYSMRFHSDRLGLSLVQDVMPLQKLVLNLISLILDFHENVNFAMRVLIQDTDNGDEPPTEGEIAEMGNHRGMTLRGAKSRMDLITPDASGVESMRVFLGEMIERIYQSVFMPSDANMNKTHQTGQTIRSNQASLYNRLAQITKYYSKALKQIVDMSLRVRGIDPAVAKVTVQWDTNFSYEAFITSIEQLSLLKETVVDIAPTIIKEYTKKVISPQLYDSGKMEQIDAEIDRWVPTPPQPPGGQSGDAQQGANPQKLNTEISAAGKIADFDANGN